MPAPSPSPLWSTSYIYAPGVPNPSSPSIPSSMSSSSSPNLLADAAAPVTTAESTASIPQHWRRVTTVCSIEPLEGPTTPDSEVSDANLLVWISDILSGELRRGGPHSGTPPLDLLAKAIQGLSADDQKAFFDGLRKLKKNGP